MGAGNKSKLLFISSVMPRPTGDGSSLRAYNTLQVLSSCFDIELLVFSMGLRKPPAPHSAVKEICSRIVINFADPFRDYRYFLQRIWAKACKRFFPSCGRQAIEICPGLTPHRKKKLKHCFGDKHFHTVHVFRLAAYPVFETISKVISHDRLQLDLDDIESDKWSQITKLHELNGNTAGVGPAAHLAAAYRQLEERVLPTVARIFVCSTQDRAKLKALYQCQQVTVLPNVYPLPERNEHKPGAGKFRLLFVGSLGYEPNADAILYFIDQILPPLRKMTTSQFALQIIGAGRLISKQARRKLAQQPEIMLTGQVDDLALYYQLAAAVIVPLRAGAGTRLKILEAFAWQVPVVSTSKGVEGLEVTHGRHALIADTPADFARQCAKLVADPSLRDTLVQNAKSLVQARYSPARLTKILCQ